MWLQSNMRRWDTAWALDAGLEHCIRLVKELMHFLAVSVLIHEEMVTLVNVHMPTTWDEAFNWEAAMASLAAAVWESRAQLGEHPLCILGDFDVDLAGMAVDAADIRK